MVSGGEEAVKDLDLEERQKLLQDTAFSMKLSIEESLAMKANLSLPWHKLRIMRR